ncbi:MAG: WecB/TagA/CpsF family glycosyltransferase [Chloroflexota bacterium]|jgi:N-acetylglucosaminyldiphosphoundecaprenol N-acetyl-beta-D-mannosaminyltransferase
MPSPSVDIMGVKVNPLTVPQLHEHLAQAIDDNRHELVLHVNVHGLNLAGELPWLHDFLNQAEIVFCDGAGVMLGARILGYHIPERITYADWIWQLAQFAGLHEYSLYLLGAQPGIALKAAEQLVAKVPNLQIAGSHHGYFNKSTDHPENEAVLADINQAQPNILLVGMGMPLQEMWLRDNWDRINTNVALTGGAVFDYVSGELRRAPRWMTDNGLEWLGRLVIEPDRLWKRYVLGNPRFLWEILRQRAK